MCHVPRYFLKSGNHMSLSVKSAAQVDRDVLGFHHGLAVIEMDAKIDGAAVRKVIDEGSSKLCGRRVILNAKNLPRKVIIINSKNEEIPLTQCTSLKPFKVGPDMLRRALVFSSGLKDCAYQSGQDKSESLSRDKKTPADVRRDKTGIACSDFQEFEAKFHREIANKDPVLSRRINNNKDAEPTRSTHDHYGSEFLHASGKPLKVYGRRKNPPAPCLPEQSEGGSPETNSSKSVPVIGHVMGKIKHFKDKNNQESHSAPPDATASDGSEISAPSVTKTRVKKKTSSVRMSSKRMLIRREIERCLMQQKRSKKPPRIRTASTQTVVHEVNTSSTQTEHFSEDEPFISSLLNGDDFFITEHGADANFGQGPTIIPIKHVDVKDGSLHDISDKFSSMNNAMSFKFDNFGVESQLEREKILFYHCLNNCTEVKTMGNLNIHLAVSQNDVAEVQRQCIALRVRQMSIDPLNDNAMTPLHLAVSNDCHPQIVLILLKFGADIALTDQDGNNPLHLAVMSGADAILGMLLSTAQQKNFKVDMFNFEGFTPLMLGTLENNYLITELLLDSKADPNLRDLKSGRTPLFHAVENNNTELVRLLLKYKANTRISNFFGTSTHEAIFELDSINQEIKSMVIGKDVFQSRSRTSDKKRRPPPARKEKPENTSVKKPKLRIVKMLKKVT